MSVRKLNQTAQRGAGTDAFSRERTSEPFGIFDNKNISNRNRNQWTEDIAGAIITYNTLTDTFDADEEIRGLLPASYVAIGTVVSDNGSSSMTINCIHNDFTIGDTITGQSSGATAVVVSTNTGSDAQHDYNIASVTLTAGTGATDKTIRQTHRYHAHVPGKSQLILQTFVLGTAVANAVKRVGYFDDNDGLFLEQNGTTDVALVRRTSTSGSVVDNRVAQASWNLDTLDGNGPSRITLDLTKTQILVIDFQWLGVGRIRYGFDIAGVLIYVHEILNANTLGVVYMRTPSLPVRFEISNSGSTASPTSTTEICSSVVSEGGYRLPGFEFSQSMGITNRAVTTRAPIFAIRLKASFNGQNNRRTAGFLSAGVVTATNDAHFEVVHIHEPYDITATWTAVDSGSALEYSVDISAITGRPSHTIENLDATTSAGNKAQSDTISGEFINAHGFLSQNKDSDNSELFVIYATSTTGTANVRGHLTWIEYD